MKCCQLRSIALSITALVSVQFIDVVEISARWSQKVKAGQLPALARDTRPLTYIPPAGLGAPKRTQGGGSRGCNVAADNLTLLAPLDQVGLTAAAHPTFVWHIAATTAPISFTLTEAGSTQPLWTQEVAAQTIGMNQLTLPEHASKLVPGKRYRMTLTQTCSKRSAESLSARAWVQRAETTADKTITATSVSAQAQQLAHDGLWYDAVAALAQTYATTSDQTTARSLLALLDQSGLQHVAAQERQRLNIK